VGDFLDKYKTHYCSEGIDYYNLEDKIYPLECVLTIYHKVKRRDKRERKWENGGCRWKTDPDPKQRSPSNSS
jgi:hypothetical protein